MRDNGITFNIKSSVFNAVYLPYLKSTIPIQIFFGGSSSGKSKFVSQRWVLDMLKGDRNYLVVRNVANTLRSTCFMEARKSISEFKADDYFTINVSNLEITCNLNGRMTFFRGLDDPEKIKSITPRHGVITDLWLEEATEVVEAAFNQLVLRMRGPAGIAKRITMTFNPISSQHWIKRRFFEGFTKKKLVTDGRLILKTTHLDNNYLDDEDHDRIEAFKDVDDFYYRVYALGEWGVLGDVVYKNWTMEDLSEREFNGAQWRNGLDFGYSGDPAAFTRSTKKGKTIYVPVTFYRKKLTNPALAEAILPLVEPGEVVWCDSAEPKSIQELRECGVNAQPVRKRRFVGKLSASKSSSILHGIQWLQQHKIVSDIRNQEFNNELGIYQWAKDKWGESLPVPVDKHNHGLDAIRYSYENEMVGTSIGVYTEREYEREQENVPKTDEELVAWLNE